MASVLSDLITNRDATPSVRTDARRDGAVLKETIAIVTPAADQSASDNLIICALPSNARVTSIKVRHAEASTTGQGNFGIARFDKSSNDYVYTNGDADFFAAAYDFDDGGAATSAFVEVIDYAQITHAESIQPLWQALGLSEDPHEDLFLAIDISEVFAGGPTSITVKVQYVAV
jgi:hypothetical protein